MGKSALPGHCQTLNFGNVRGRKYCITRTDPATHRHVWYDLRILIKAPPYHPVALHTAVMVNHQHGNRELRTPSTSKYSLFIIPIQSRNYVRFVIWLWQPCTSCCNILGDCDVDCAPCKYRWLLYLYNHKITCDSLFGSGNLVQVVVIY